MATHCVVKIDSDRTRAWLARDHHSAYAMEEGIQAVAGGRTLVIKLQFAADASTKALVLRLNEYSSHDSVAWPSVGGQQAEWYAKGIKDALGYSKIQVVNLEEPGSGKEKSRAASPVRKSPSKPEPETAMFQGQSLPVFRGKEARKNCPMCGSNQVAMNEGPGGLHMCMSCSKQYIIK